MMDAAGHPRYGLDGEVVRALQVFRALDGRLAWRLWAAGYRTRRAVVEASDRELLAVPYLTTRHLRAIRADL